MFSLICVWINGWVNNRKAGHLRRYHAHCDVTVMTYMFSFHLIQGKLTSSFSICPENNEVLNEQLYWWQNAHYQYMNIINKDVGSIPKVWRLIKAEAATIKAQCSVNMVMVTICVAGIWDIMRQSWLFLLTAFLYLRFNEFKRVGVTGFTFSICPSVRPSICPSVDGIVSALYLHQYKLDPFHIYTSY